MIGVLVSRYNTYRPYIYNADGLQTIPFFIILNFLSMQQHSHYFLHDLVDPYMSYVPNLVYSTRPHSPETFPITDVSKKTSGA